MLEAVYFDGKTARRHAVRCRIRDGEMSLVGSDIDRRVPVHLLVVGEALAGAPRTIELPDGARCEIADGAELRALLATAGIGESLVVRLQKRWRWALAALALVLASGSAAYLWGLPALAQLIAQRLPTPVVTAISTQVFAELDKQYFTPSELPIERQQQIEHRLAARYGNDLGQRERAQWSVLFRASARLGSNALAFPDGKIVLLDDLVNKLSDVEIDAVVAHELGHIAHRDALRLLVQHTVLAVALTAWLGDVSSAAAGMGSILLQSGYSREAELAADAYAARQLVANGQSPDALISSLSKLERPGEQAASALSTHPDTAARIAAIRALPP